MKYLLSQEEYDALTPVKRLQERNEALEIAREIIVKLAGVNCGQEYCDRCPISFIGTNPDDIIDINRPSPENSRLICIRPRNHGK